MNTWPAWPWLKAIMGAHLTSGPLYIGALALAAIGVTALIIRQLTRKDRLCLVPQLLCAAVAGAIGFAVTWFLSDKVMAFGVSLGWVVISTIAVGIGAVGFLAATIHHAVKWRKAAAIALIPVTLVATALQVDSIYGEYQTLGDLVGYSPYPRLTGITTAKDTVSLKEWEKLAADGDLSDMPTSGSVVSAEIPATKSGFKARNALVYLPPAALMDRSPKLPVLVLLAGQPGSPGRAMSASGITAIMDSYAADHDGLAPIVVSPDQNGANTHNSLCADTTRYGKAETYLTKDVPAWIRANLPAAAGAENWAIAGFSQGGTCTTQLGPRHPDLFGTMFAVDGERAPTDGSVEHMVSAYFGGERSRYEEQVPVNAIAAHAPSTQAMVLAAGANDPTSVENVRAIGEAASKAGMTTVKLRVPGTGHDWHAVNATLEAAVPWWCARMGLGPADGGASSDSSDSSGDSDAGASSGADAGSSASSGADSSGGASSDGAASQSQSQGSHDSGKAAPLDSLDYWKAYPRLEVIH